MRDQQSTRRSKRDAEKSRKGLAGSSGQSSRRVSIGRGDSWDGQASQGQHAGRARRSEHDQPHFVGGDVLRNPPVEQVVPQLAVADAKLELCGVEQQPRAQQVGAALLTSR